MLRLRPDDEDDLISRAHIAWLREERREGANHTHPSNESGVEKIDGKAYVVLRNINGILRVYRVRNDGKLKALKRVPAELRE